MQAATAEAYDIMTDNGEEAFRQRADIQRDLGRLEGKVDSLLGSVTGLTQALVRSDAERDNLAREVAVLERKQAAEAALANREQDEERLKLERAVNLEIGKLWKRMYYLAGLIAAGGIGVGAAAGKVFGTLLH